MSIDGMAPGPGSGLPALHALLVDPSLYTAPYDGALTQGLLAAAVEPRWLVRPARRGEREEIPAALSDAVFYRRVDGAARLPGVLRAFLKGCAHAAGLAALLRRVRRDRPQVVHLQWVVVPALDLVAMAWIRRRCALVLTVHDSVPYNGEAMSWLQRLGQRLPARLAHRVIVHTRAARDALVRDGIPAARVYVIPHGPLRLAASVAPRLPRDPRWTAVLFGEIKPYKGLDVLIDAVAALDPAARQGLRVVVAGRARMDLAPLAARIRTLGIGGQVELRPGRLSEEEMAALFEEADGFVFPYRQVDASGVYYLVKSLGKWLIASRVGIFAEELEGRRGGELVPPGDAAALAQALGRAAAGRPRGAPAGEGSSWAQIGRDTRALYEQVRTEFDARGRK